MTREYRVKTVRGDWGDHQRCSVGISVGGHFHEGNKFRATMRWVGGHFQSCHIFVCDSLQRFNELAYYRGEHEEARLQALESGTQWLSNNRAAMEECSASELTVTRWDQWLSHPEAKERIEGIAKLYREHTTFREGLDSDVHRYLKNNWQVLQEDGVPYEERHRGGIEYMIEELAILGLIAEEVSPVEIYAGPESQGATVIRELQIQDAPRGLRERQSVKIDFRPRGSSSEDKPSQ